MISITVTTREGEQRRIEGREGESLMEAIRDAGIDELVAMCGGGCSCATCHVYIDSHADTVGPSRGDEDDLLEVAEYRRDASRLSCQVILSSSLDDLRVTIAPEE